MPEIAHLLAETVDDWHSWLKKNHQKESKVFLIRYKRHTGKQYFNQKEAMDEAICWGWIDTTIKRIDDDKYGVTFVKRTSKSRWSNNTIARGKRMIKEKRMSPFGLKMYKEGLAKPVIDHGLPKNPDTPKDLAKLLSKNKKAKENFEKFPPSAKRYYIYWIEKAVRPETRDKRVKEVFELSKNNIKPGAL